VASFDSLLKQFFPENILKEMNEKQFPFV